jgi:chemotaxis signal transduction protein
LVVQAIPSLVRVSNDNVLPLAEESESNDPLIRQAVELDMNTAFIPDLDEVEQRIHSVLEQI